MLNAVFKAARLKATELDKNFIFDVIENILASKRANAYEQKNFWPKNNYTFFKKSNSFFAENKLYYRVRDTILPSTRHDTTEYATRSPFQKVAILSSGNAVFFASAKIL